MRRLLITDLDNTLLDAQSQVSPENLSAIAAHVAAGGLFTIATGRAPAAARIFPELFPYINLPVITGNGGQICDLITGEVFYRCTLPRALEGLLPGILADFPELGCVIYHGYDGFYRFCSNDYVDELVGREKRAVIDVTIEASPKPWNKILLTNDHAYMEHVAEYLVPHIAGLARTVFSEANFLEILPLEVSKGAALQFIMERAGLVPAQVVAVGDALNDFEMIQVAGIGVAVGNAAPELKAVADVVVCNNTEHAIRACVEQFLQ